VRPRVYLELATTVLIITALALLSACLIPSTNTSSTRTEVEVEDEIYRLVNEERQSAGIGMLARDPILDSLAREYSASGFSDAVERSSDIRFLLSNSWRVTYRNGSPRLGDDTAGDQVDYCLQSYDLQNTMLRSDARRTGIGVAVLGNTVHYTQVFDILNTVFGDGDLVTLYENDRAENPSWNQLRQFVLNDDTDEQLYEAGSFICTDFAAMLHDRAEAAGIRTAYVNVDHTAGPGHALNAFNTTDRGMVYIDCTGPGLNITTSGGTEEGDDTDASYDKVAYLSTGSEYGLISIERASSFDYAFYEWWTGQWEAYQTEIELYEQKRQAYEEALGGRTVITDPNEYKMLQNMGRELETLKENLEIWEDQLGSYYWESMGIVADYYVHW
jgi:hypothetical protein